MSIRAGLAGAAALLLTGCGFRPLYMPEHGQPGVAARGLAAIYVPVLLNRDGQLMRQALQQRVEGSGSGVAKEYELLAQPVISGEGIAIQRDSSTTRVRLNGSVTWVLRKLDLAHTVVASGSGRIVDGYNILNEQYFAADLEGEAGTRRIVTALADQVVQQVAIYFRRQAANPAAPPPAISASPAPGPIIPFDAPVPGGVPGEVAPDIITR